MKYIVSVKTMYRSETSTEVEANSADEAFDKAMHLFKANGIDKMLPLIPRAYARIVPSSTNDIPRSNRP